MRLWLTACALALAACGSGAPSGPEIPDGFAIAGGRVALDRLLATFEELPESPAATEAVRLRSQLPDCPLLAAAAPREDPQRWLASIVCAEARDLPPALADRLENADVAFALPIGDSGRLVGGLRIDAEGGARVEATLTQVPSEGIASLLIPSEKPTGAANLSARDALLHARFRPLGGLDLSRLVPEASQADQLFRLRSKLFSSTALAGSWEIAMYRPLEGQRVPPIAIAAAIAAPTAARVGLDQFIGEIEATWQVHSVVRKFSDTEGRCFFDLRILPNFEPCFVLSDDSLTIGWNPSAIHAALAQSDGIAPDPINGFVIYLDRLAEADEQLRRTFTPNAPAPIRSFPWTHFEGSAASAADGISIHASLRGSP